MEHRILRFPLYMWWWYGILNKLILLSADKHANWHGVVKSILPILGGALIYVNVVGKSIHYTHPVGILYSSAFHFISANARNMSLFLAYTMYILCRMSQCK